MKVALVYDRVNKWGGAERILLALHKLFPDAPLHTSIFDEKKAPWAKVFNIKTSFLQKVPFAMRHELFPWLMPLAFESFNFDEFDVVISVTSEAGKGIITKPGTRHICYCLTPTRYLWSGYDEYFKNIIFRIISKPIVWYLRFWDRIAAKRPDKFIAISREVQNRIKKYYENESKVIYPSIEFARQTRLSDDAQYVDSKLTLNSTSLSKIRHQSEAQSNFNSSESGLPRYYLIVSRLVPYKKIDLAIETFNKLKLPLKIIGTGSEERRLKAISGPTIEFLGNLTDKELVGYYSGCNGLVFPGHEDFGLTILEAQSFGKPVIAFKAGGALETVIEGKTGVFFDKQTVESLEGAIGKFNKSTFNPKECIKQAEKFNFENFKKGITEEVLKKI